VKAISLRYILALLVLNTAMLAETRAVAADWVFEERPGPGGAKTYAAHSGFEFAFECGHTGAALWLRLNPLAGQAAGTEATVGFATALTGVRRLTGKPQSGVAFGEYAARGMAAGPRVLDVRVTGNQVLDIARKLGDADEVTFTVEPRIRSETKVSLEGASEPLNKLLRSCP
jgi:hypothetical protein